MAKAKLSELVSIDDDPPVEAQKPEAPVEAPQSPVVPSEKEVSTQQSPKAQKAPEDPVAAAELLLQRAMELKRQQAIANARFPWENPAITEKLGRVGYNVKIDPELKLQIDYIMEHKGGFRSIQSFYDQAAKRYAKELLNELTSANPK
jgi:hypothetical protein